MLRIYIKFAIYLVVVACISSANAGSYDDFFVAIKRDEPQAVATLLARGFDANTTDADGQCGLFLALRDGSDKVARVLADWKGTKVELRNPHDESPLMMAALRGNLEIARKLVERDADVNKPGWTPLHYAATNGHLEIMKLLLDHSAYIDAVSPNGTTPLMMASQYGTTEAVKLLLDAGADPALKNQLGLTAIDFAWRANRRDAADLIAAAQRASQPKGKW